VIPEGWKWGAFLAKAVKFVIFAFEKRDAHVRWGRENVFHATMGGRSLRYTGEIIYSMSVQSQYVHESTEKATELITAHEDETLNKIGGRECWEKFSAEISAAGYVDEEEEYEEYNDDRC
jgi:hypothetical protein